MKATQFSIGILLGIVGALSMFAGYALVQDPATANFYTITGIVFVVASFFLCWGSGRR
jgi:hypothetical protein